MANAKTSAVLVTGASSGIGAAVTRLLLQAGRPVVAVARHGETLQALYGNIPGACLVAADLATESGIEAVCRAAKERFGVLGGFVHCAGFDAVAPLGLVTAESMQALFRVHVIAAVRLLAWLSKKPNHVPGASAVLISSQAARGPAMGHLAYAAAKGALDGMAPTLEAELKLKGVSLHLIAPAVVKTPMSAAWLGKLTDGQRAALEASIPGGFAEPEAIAGQILAWL